jgi:hypothetical protein
MFVLKRGIKIGKIEELEGFYYTFVQLNCVTIKHFAYADYPVCG